MRTLFKLSFLVLAAGFAGCGGSSVETADEPIQEPAPVLAVPGTISLPGETGFTKFPEEEHQAILLYCWIPMGQYPESEADLIFLSTLGDRGITPLPVQFSTDVRNASQNQVNQLGLPLAVNLGDDSLKAFMNLQNMPTAVLVQSTGEIVRASGFGCAERIVRSIR